LAQCRCTLSSHEQFCRKLEKLSARFLDQLRADRAVLRFSGAIGVVTPLRPGLSLATSAAAIEKAFAMSGAKAVAIQINSPGGSAVQSMLIYKRIRALAAEKDLKVYVFAEDVAASGGYLLAARAMRSMPTRARS
jgi:ClpP class serine protease